MLMYKCIKSILKYSLAIVVFFSPVGATWINVESDFVMLSFDDGPYKEYKKGFYNFDDISKICIQENIKSKVLINGLLLDNNCTLVNTHRENKSFSILDFFKKIAGFRSVDNYSESESAESTRGIKYKVQAVSISKDGEGTIIDLEKNTIKIPKKSQYIYIGIGNYSQHPRVYVNKQKIKYELVPFKKDFYFVKIDSHLFINMSELMILDKIYSNKASLLKVVIIKK